jgi:hypothetical protein
VISLEKKPDDEPAPDEQVLNLDDLKYGFQLPGGSEFEIGDLDEEDLALLGKIEPGDEDILKEGWVPHIHTRDSDGQKTVEQLLADVASRCKFVSITDHDCIEAHKKDNFDYELGYSKVPVSYLRSGRRISKEVFLVSGVEMNCHLPYEGGNLSLEITGYGFDPHDTVLGEACEQNRSYRHAWLSQIVKNINKTMLKGIFKKKLSLQEFAKEHCVGKPQLVKALRKRKLFENDEDAYAALRDPKYKIEKETIHIDYAIWAIENAGGRCGLPHPALIAKENNLESEIRAVEILGKNRYLSKTNALFDKKFISVEAEYPYSARRPKSFDKKAEEKANTFWQDIALQYNLIELWVSDYHRDSKVKKDSVAPDTHVTPRSRLAEILKLRKKGMSLYHLRK